MNNPKNLLRVCALVLAAALLCGCSAVISNPVVAKVGDVDITYTQFYSLFETYSSYGMIDTSTSEKIKEAHATIFEQLINSALPIAIAHKQGVTLTEEEKATALEGAASAMESYLADFLDESIADEAARTEAAIQAFNKSYKPQGVTYEQVKADTEKSYLDQALGNKVAEEARAGAAAVTDADAKTWYDEQIKTERDIYAEDATAYYYDNQYYAYTGNVRPLVAPEGLFYVKHILIKSEAPEDADAAGEDAAGEDELASSDSASFRDAKQLAQTVLDKLNAGEDFDALLEEYGEDEGMTVEPAKTQGYIMGEGYDAVYDKAFYDAALKLEKTGDTSGLVEGSYGYHIIRRVGDVSTDPVPFDEVKASIHTYLTGQRQTEAYNAALEQWKGEVEITTYEKRVSYVGVR